MSLLTLFLLNGCAYKQLQMDVATLKQDVALLQAELDTVSGKQPQGIDATAARALIEVFNAQLAALAIPEAAETLDLLLTSYPGSAEWNYAQKLKDEFVVIGKEAPDLSAVDWYGDAPELGDGVTVLMFWEVWCPHCRDEMPRMQARNTVLSESGLTIVGLTRQSRDVTEQDVQDFLAENEVSFPVGREDGSLTELLNIRGVPAAAVLEDGKVIWRGHPARINWALLESKLNAE